LSTRFRRAADTVAARASSPAHAAVKEGSRKKDTLTTLRTAACLCLLSTLAAPPAAANGGNTCSTATTVIGSGPYAFDNTAATTDGPAACNVIGSDLWWRWQAPCSTQVTVSTCGLTSLDTIISVYSGGKCPVSSALACNDDDCAFQSAATFTSTEGTTYLIRIGGFNGAQGSGSFSLDFNCCPTTLLTSTTTGPGGPPVLSPAAAERTLGRLYRARDRVLHGTPTGRRWTLLFYKHSPAMWRILSDDRGLRRRATALVAAIGPGLDALAADEPPARATRIPPYAVALLESVLDDFERADAGGELAHDLRAEREVLDVEHLAGRTYAEAWERINERGGAAQQQALEAEPAVEPPDATPAVRPDAAKPAPAKVR
jgi:hypothetical protein